MPNWDLAVGLAILWGRIDQPVAGGVGYHLGAVAQVELPQDIPKVVLHGVLGDDEFFLLQLDSMAVAGEPLARQAILDRLLGLANPATIELIAYKPLRGAPRLAPLITAIGMSFILQDVALAWKGPEYVSVPAVLPKSEVFRAGGVVYTWDKLIVLIITVPVLLVLMCSFAARSRGRRCARRRRIRTPPR